MSEFKVVKKIAVVCALRHGNEFLLLKRSKMPHAGRYSPVGGKLELHENPRACAIRETYEETGIQIAPDALKFAGILTESSPTDYNWILYVYYADIEKVNPPACNEGVLEWVDPMRVAKELIPPTDFYFYEAMRAEKAFVLDAVYDAQEEMLVMRDELTGDVLFERED